MTVYYRVGRLLRPCFVVFFRVHTLIFHQPRARALVRNERGEILLVKSWVGHDKWGLPGGGVNRGESWVAAARRELYEETGIQAPMERFTHVMTVRAKGFDVPIFAVTVEAADLPAKRHNRHEVTHVGWHDPNNLPEVMPTIHEVLREVARLA